MVQNGSFEALNGSFSDWSTIGNTAIVNEEESGVTPVDGEFQAFASTGDGRSGGPASASDIEHFLDLPEGTLVSLGAGTEGSAFKQLITLEAGDTISVDTNFVTDEATPTFFNDYSFLTLSPVIAIKLDDTNSDFEETQSAFLEETGYSTTEFTVLQDGDYLLGFGLVDAFDDVVDSGLFVDNITVRPRFEEELPPGLLPPDLEIPPREIVGELPPIEEMADPMIMNGSDIVDGEPLVM